MPSCAKMKRTLLPVLLLLVAATPLWAQLIYTDSMSYAGGDITANSTNLWLKHSNAGNPDSLVVNGRYEIHEDRKTDIHRWFSPADTNGYLSGSVWASFVLKMTKLPTRTEGTYFAHFMDAAATNGAGGGFEFR